MLKNDQSIEQAYRERTPGSARLAAQAPAVLPGGVVHDARYLKPYCLYIERAEGSCKWDVDGNRYIDYYGGHGALMLGHNRPEVVAAASEQLTRGSHFAAGNALEIRWAELITEMLPCAERVRFHSSGTEATMMAVRMARALTGRPKLMRFFGHYHGWQDDMTTGYVSHFDGTATVGVPKEVAAQTVIVDPYDEKNVESLLAPGNDIAAVIVEPLGAATGRIPLDIGFIRKLREWTHASGTILIFDEVVTGFRVSSGGFQKWSGITPDMSSLAKIVAGGLPGGAITGRAELIDGLDFDESRRGGREKIVHNGTFNACPVSAAAGVTALQIIRDTDACESANKLAAELRDRLQNVVQQRDVPWSVYGEASVFQVHTGIDGKSFEPRQIGFQGFKTQAADTVRLLRLAMNLHGVDLTGWPGGLVSAAHTEADIEATAHAFDASIEWLRREGVDLNA